MTLEIITPDKTIFSGNVFLVQVPCIDGRLEILHNHAPMIAALTKGKVKVEIDPTKEIEYFEISDGILKVQSNVISILIYHL